MELNGRSIPRRIRDAVAHRAGALTIATAFVLLGLYPGPALLLLRDPGWRTDIIVTRLADERAFWISGLLVVVGPAIVLANMIPRWFDRVWEMVQARVGAVREHWFMTGAAVFATIAAAMAATYVLSKKPSTSDEVAQLWHARMLLSGRLWLPADPNPEFFAIDNVIDQGRWYSQFPIGGPAVFSLAMLLHATWLLNPLLAGLTVVNVYRFASQVYGPAEARVSAALCATCPFLLLMSGSYMNHTLVAFLTTLALAELPPWVVGSEPRRTSASIIIGLSLGLAIAVRPLDGAIATLALGGFMAFTVLRRERVRAFLVIVAAGAVPIAGLLVTNWLTTGRPLLFGYEVLWGANHSLGFHDDPSGNPHTPSRALVLATAYVMQLNWSLFEWPIAGLLIVSGALVVIGRLRQWDTVLIVWICVQLAAFAAYWHAGNLFGPRYLFTVLPALLLIVAHGLVLAVRTASPVARRAVVAAVGASMLASWTIPATPVGALGSAEAVRPARTAFRVDVGPAVRSLEGTRALIFVSETSTSRLIRRLWGIGISRPDAARLVATKDNCALLDFVLDEARRVGSPGERLSRLEQAKSYAPPAGYRLLVTDLAFRTSDRRSITPLCRAELMLDASRRGAISYGQTLLLNQIGGDGRITGPVVFVADLAEHNEVLRARFADRPWYRLELPKGATDPLPQLVPYR
jgi:hypothetical protein